MVNVSDKSDVNGEKWTTEKMRLGSRIVTIPPSKSCTSGTNSQSLWIPLIKDNPLAGVFREGAVSDDMSRVVTKGALSVQTDTGEVTEAPAKRAVVVRATVLGVTWSTLMAVRAFIFRAVDTKMPLVVTLKTNSCHSRDRLWAQPGISRHNSSGV